MCKKLNKHTYVEHFDSVIHLLAQRDSSTLLESEINIYWMSYFELAYASVENKDTAKAKAHFEQGLKIKEMLIAEKKDILHRRHFVKDYNTIGNIFKESDKFFAESCYKKAIIYIIETSQLNGNETYKSKEEFLADFNQSSENLMSLAKNLTSRIKYISWITKQSKQAKN